MKINISQQDEATHIISTLILIIFMFILTVILIRVCYSLYLYISRSRLIDHWDEATVQSYDLARSFEATHPPNSIPTDFTDHQRRMIQEKGVGAWEFDNSDDINAFVSDRTELIFYGGDNSIQSNLPVPTNNSIYYFEVKLFQLEENTNVGIGLATKPYPCWRFPGQNKTSVGFHTKNGRKYYNDPFQGSKYGPISYEADVIGCGYRPQSGTIFYTRNGVKLGDAYSGIKHNIFPTIAADGPCILHINLGQAGFVFIEANIGKWGFAPIEGNLMAPPAYGKFNGTILVESASSSRNNTLRGVNIGDDHNLGRLESNKILPYKLEERNTESIDVRLGSPPPDYISQHSSIDS